MNDDDDGGDAAAAAALRLDTDKAPSTTDLALPCPALQCSASSTVPVCVIQETGIMFPPTGIRNPIFSPSLSVHI